MFIGKREYGISLIESMIALLIISVGLLGIAALQVTSTGQNASALNHSRATWMAYNMADRIRANGDPDDYIEVYGDIDTHKDYAQSCINTDCSRSQMAAADAAEWADMMNALPAGRGIVRQNADGLLVTVMWDDEGTGASGTGCGPNPEQDLTCYMVAVAVPSGA